MNRVTTFSTSFPSYHPKKGEPTFFVERILYGLIKDNYPGCGTELLKSEHVDVINFYDLEPKHHTIRAGSRFKAGDYLLPRIWTGKPYRSKQFQFAPALKITGVWNIEMRFEQNSPVAIVENQVVMWDEFKVLAKNDGLTPSDLMSWFNKTFYGQIICWNSKINY